MIYDRQEECMRVTLQMHFTSMAPHVTARQDGCQLLPEKSRGCGDDGEWWQSLCRGFDGFRVSSVLMFLHYASMLTLMTLINA